MEIPIKLNSQETGQRITHCGHIKDSFRNHHSESSLHLGCSLYSNVHRIHPNFVLSFEIEKNYAHKRPQNNTATIILLYYILPEWKRMLHCIKTRMGSKSIIFEGCSDMNTQHCQGRALRHFLVLQLTKPSPTFAR